MNMSEVHTVEDIRALFSVDASFVNLDDQFYVMYAEDPSQLPPFDEVIAKTDWKENLHETIFELGRRLKDFDNDFIYFDFEIIETQEVPIVSVVFNISEI